MNSKLLLVALLALAISCKKEKNDPAEKKSATELLTQKAWILTEHGFDDNKNGVIDQSESLILDCHKDNTYIFNTTGIGAFFENAIKCGGPEQNEFQWELVNDSTMKLDHEKLFILRLNENEMMLSPDMPWLTVKYIFIYRH